MADDTDQFAKVAQYMVAVFNDENKARRLMEILEAERKLNDARLALDAQTAVNAQQMEEAQKHHADAKAVLANADQRHAEADGRERTLGAMSEDMSAEKARWNEQKDLVERQHTDREASLNAREQNMTERERNVKAREDAVGSREDSARVMAEAAQKIIAWAKHGPDL